jgi:hypothetical protein
VNLAICAAIRSRKVVQFIYDDYIRVVEPYCHGTSAADNELLRGYQIGGQAESANPVGWKLFTVSKITGFIQTGDVFPTNRPGYTPYDSAMRDVHCHV